MYRSSANADAIAIAIAVFTPPPIFSSRLRWCFIAFLLAHLRRVAPPHPDVDSLQAHQPANRKRGRDDNAARFFAIAFWLLRSVLHLPPHPFTRPILQLPVSPSRRMNGNASIFFHVAGSPERCQQPTYSPPDRRPTWASKTASSSPKFSKICARTRSSQVKKEKIGKKRNCCVTVFKGGGRHCSS